MEVKVGVLDRIEQAFMLFRNNFLDFFLPMFIYNLITIVVVLTILIGMFFGSIGSLFSGSLDVFIEGFNIFTFLNNPFVVISIAVGMLFFIVYLILYIPILLGLLKSIKQAVNKEKITPKDNLSYGFSNLLNSFKTYWYIFAYVALIPALFFIVGGLLFNFGYFKDLSDLKQTGAFLMIFGTILFLIFAIYKGIKSTFAIYSAVNKDSFTKENFLNAINITTNNWWRILGNFFLVGLIVSLVSGFISGIISLLTYSGNDFESIGSIEDLLSIAKEFSIVGQIFSGFFDSIINTIGTVFIIVFTYIFFLQLEKESLIGNEIKTEKSIESKEL